MNYKKHDFIAFSADSQRVVANLEQSYATWVDLKRSLNSLASSMFWTEKEGVEYLNIKKTASDNGTTVGRREATTEAQFNTHTEAKTALKDRIRLADAQLRERASLYRRLRLPAIPDRQAEILRCLDIEGMLGTDLMVVGTNAFVAYELACGARFPTGNEETEDFDMAWCRGTTVSLAQSTPAESVTRAGAKSLFRVLKSLDSSYEINQRKPYQAVNGAGYEVELLAAPSTHPLPKSEPFEPMKTLVEQEWLLKGTPFSVVVATVRGRACPLYVPDPRWMALHKLWLSEKAQRNPSKRPKDRRQGDVLLDATRFFLRDSHPLNVDFVLGLPEELLPHFNLWCESRSFVPPLE